MTPAADRPSRAVLNGNGRILQHHVAELQKLLDHRGIVLNFVTGALANLQLGRAYATTAGETTRAKAAYQDFLILWKDADPDIPILKVLDRGGARHENSVYPQLAA